MPERGSRQFRPRLRLILLAGAAALGWAVLASGPAQADEGGTGTSSPMKPGRTVTFAAGAVGNVTSVAAAEAAPAARSGTPGRAHVDRAAPVVQIPTPASVTPPASQAMREDSPARIGSAVASTTSRTAADPKRLAGPANARVVDRVVAATRAAEALVSAARPPVRQLAGSAQTTLSQVLGTTSASLSSDLSSLLEPVLTEVSHPVLSTVSHLPGTLVLTRPDSHGEVWDALTFARSAEARSSAASLEEFRANAGAVVASVVSDRLDALTGPALLIAPVLASLSTGSDAPTGQPVPATPWGAASPTGTEASSPGSSGHDIPARCAVGLAVPGPSTRGAVLCFGSSMPSSPLFRPGFSPD